MNEKEMELRKVWEFTKDFWQLIKKYYFQPEDPSAPYWPALISEADDLATKHNHHRLAEKLILAFLDYEEEVREKGQEKGRETLGNPDRGGIGSTGKG